MKGEELPGTVNVDKNREARSISSFKGKILWKNSEMHMVKNKSLSSMAEDHIIYRMSISTVRTQYITNIFNWTGDFLKAKSTLCSLKGISSF